MGITIYPHNPPMAWGYTPLGGGPSPRIPPYYRTKRQFGGDNTLDNAKKIFGKNLSFFRYLLKTKIIMKKIIRLTESDLRRLVKRVISEQTYDVRRAAQQIVDSVEGLGTDEETLRRVLGELQKVDDQTLMSFYDVFYNLTKLGTLRKYIDQDVSPAKVPVGGKNQKDFAGKMAVKAHELAGSYEAKAILGMASGLDQRHSDIRGY